jgi:hypothetical protein
MGMAQPPLPAPPQRACAAGLTGPAGIERARLGQLLERDGAAQARSWARRTAALYRTAVLDHEHYAHTAAYRRRFIESYLELKRFARGDAHANPVLRAPDGSAPSQYPDHPSAARAAPAAARPR